MSVFTARLGQLEARRTAQTLWSSGKRRKTGAGWTSSQCGWKWTEKRLYNDASLRWTGLALEDAPAERAKTQTYARRRQASESHISANSVERENDSAKLGPNAADQGADAATFLKDEDILDESRSDENGTSRLQQELMQQQFENDELLTTDDDGTVLADFHVPPVPNPTPSALDDVIQNLYYKAELPRALAKGEADMVARCIFAAKAEKDVDFISSISTSAFTKVLELLKPEGYITQLASEHVELSPAKVQYFEIVPMRDVASQYSSFLLQVLSIRRSQGQKLALEDYRNLLQSMRDLGSKDVAVTVWRTMHEDGHVPDTACYNHYMASVLWNNSHNASTRRRVRVTDFNLDARRRDPNPLNDYQVGPSGVRDQVLSIFKQMLQNGAVANEESLLIVMTAAAREGDMDMVKTFLNRGWSLNVDKLLAGDQGLEITSRKASKQPPLQPTSELLFTLAHAYGVNNDIPSALRIIDYVARQYSIEITERVWGQLFTWTFVLSTKRQSSPDDKVGRLPGESLMQLWQTMTEAPYFFKPSLSMYNQLIKNLCQRKCTDVMCGKMEEGYELYLKDREMANSARKELRTALEDADSEVSLEHLRKRWEIRDLTRRRDFTWLKRWVGLLLSSLAEWSRVRNDTAIERLPALLWKWREMAPTTVQYETRTGVIQFDIRTQEEVREGAVSLQKARARHRRLRNSVPLYIGDSWLRGKFPKVRYVPRPRSTVSE